STRWELGQALEGIAPGMAAEAPRELDLVSALREGATPAPIPFALKQPDREEGPLVNGDVTIISGEGKVGKSVTALGIALSITAGIPLGGVLVPTGGPRRVLYLDSENNERLIVRRWRQLVAGAGCVEAIRAWGASPLLHYVW